VHANAEALALGDRYYQRTMQALYRVLKLRPLSIPERRFASVLHCSCFWARVCADLPEAATAGAATNAVTMASADEMTAVCALALSNWGAEVGRHHTKAEWQSLTNGPPSGSCPHLAEADIEP
jgi:hypothetical protein